MQMLSRAGEDLPFFIRQPRCQRKETEPSPEEFPVTASETGATCSSTSSPAPLASLEFVTKATSGAAAVFRHASTRARRALVDLKDDLVGDILSDLSGGGAAQQHVPASPAQEPGYPQQQGQQQQGQQHPQQGQVPSAQGPGWVLPWAMKTDGERQREDVRRRVRELSKDPVRFLVLDTAAPCTEDEDELLHSAVSAALEEDAALQALHEELVPRMLPGVEFWRRYFRAVKEIQRDVAAKQAAAQLSLSSAGAGGTSSPYTPGAEAPGVSSSVSFLGRGAALAGWATFSAPRAVSVVRSFDVDSDEGLDSTACSSTQERMECEACADATRCGAAPTQGDCARCCGREGAAGEGALGVPELPCFSSLGGSPASEASNPALAEPPGILRQVSSTSAEILMGMFPTSFNGRDAAGAEAGFVPSAAGFLPKSSPLAPVSQRQPGSASALLPAFLGLGRSCSDGFGGGLPRVAGAAVVEAQVQMQGVSPPDIPASSSLRNLVSASVAAMGYTSCTELIVTDLSSMWPRLGPLSAVAEGLRRHSLTGQHRNVLPPRWGPWVAAEARATLASGCSGTLSPQGPSVPQRMADLLFEVVALDWSHTSRGAAGGAGCVRLGPCFSRSLHGAPLGSFVCHLAAAVAGLETVQEMAQLWLEVVKKLREHFEAGELIPGVPCDALQQPDLQLCEVMQNLQLLNLCVKRRKSREQRLARVENGEDRTSTSDLKASQPGPLRRRGVKQEAPGLVLLATGQPLCIPETQDTPLMTETAVREQEEQIIRTGMMGSGCEQLMSDMQAFKAANPGCILEDFVRWYSPPDWSPEPFARPHESEEAEVCQGESELPHVSMCRWAEQGQSFEATEGGALLSRKGYLSIRMTFSGNQWKELWEEAEAVPAIEQPPLFDEEAGGRRSLQWLEDIAPVDLLDQLFLTLVGAGLTLGQSLPEAAKEPFKSALVECSRYASTSCSKGMGSRRQDMACLVYEVLEVALERARQWPANSEAGKSTPPQPLTPLFSPVVRGEGPPDVENTKLAEVSGELRLFHSAGREAPGHEEEVGTSTDIPVRDVPVAMPDAGSCDEAFSAPASQEAAAQGLRTSTSTSVDSSDAVPQVGLSSTSAPSGLVCTTSVGSGLDQKERATSSLREAAASLLQRMKPRSNWSRPYILRPGTSQNLLSFGAPGRGFGPTQQAEEQGEKEKAEFSTPDVSGRVSPTRCGLSDGDACSLGSLEERDPLALTEDVLTPKSSGWIAAGLSERFWSRTSDLESGVPSLEPAVPTFEEERPQCGDNGGKPSWKFGERSFGKLFGSGCKPQVAGVVTKEREVDGDWVVL